MMEKIPFELTGTFIRNIKYVKSFATSYQKIRLDLLLMRVLAAEFTYVILNTDSYVRDKEIYENLEMELLSITKEYIDIIGRISYRLY